MVHKRKPQMTIDTEMGKLDRLGTLGLVETGFMLILYAESQEKVTGWLFHHNNLYQEDFHPFTVGPDWSNEIVKMRCWIYL